MDDKIIRSEVMEDDEKTIKYQVMEKKDDKIIRHQVIGIGEAEPVLEHLNVTENGTYTPGAGVDGFDEVNVNVSDIPAVINPLSVTENGTYTAPSGVDGYSPVTVNVPSALPSEYLESEFDLLHSNSTDGFPDLVKNWKIPTNRYSDFSNGYITGRNCSVNMQYINFGDIKRIVVKTGEFDRSQEPNEEWLNLMRLSDGDWHFNLTFNTSDNYWRVSDSAGGIIDIPSSILPKYSFDNTTFEIIYGAKYINDTLYCGKKVNGAITENYRDSLFVYLNGELVMSNPEKIFSCLRVGGGNGWIGAKFENVKVYTVTDCYNRYYEEV